jgi:hypothetical protein
LLFKIAGEIGQSVEWILHNVSTLELQGWAKYYEYLHQQQTKRMG